MTERLAPPPTERQVAFHQLLLGARGSWLLPAVRQALAEVDQDAVNRDLAVYAPQDARRILAAAGIRDEYVFPTPTVLHAAPKLVGYYRLLLGRSQKLFYGEDGFGSFASAEKTGALSPRQSGLVTDFCHAMGSALAELVQAIGPVLTARDIEELPILTLGSQLQGANNVIIGRQATAQVFLAILDVIPEAARLQQSETRALVRNASGRDVTLELAADPDVGILEEVGRDVILKRVAIEIKGGTDRSNAHNRAGEAEKSHTKARAAGYRECWTIISLRGVDVNRLRAESLSTDTWFDIREVLARNGQSWDEFRHRIAVTIGIPLA